jgi:hypothetical protein
LNGARRDPEILAAVDVAGLWVVLEFLLVDGGAVVDSKCNGGVDIRRITIAVSLGIFVILQGLLHCLALLNILCRIPLSIFTTYWPYALRTASSYCRRTTLSTASRLPRAFLPLPHLPHFTTQSSGICCVYLIIELLGPATVHALNGSPTSCQVLLQSFRHQTRCSSEVFLHH